MYNSIGDVSSHLPSSSSNAAATSRNLTIPYALLHQQQQQLHHPIMIPHLPLPPLPLPMPPFSAPGGGSGGVADDDDDDDFPRRDERFPQWSNQETRDFVEIRGQLEWDFNSAKRNKNLWEMVASRMRDKGYRRTVDQCKCKWKNLVHRYKMQGQESSDMENGRQCPFFEELHALFTTRANRMPPPVDTDSTNIPKGKKRLRNISEDQSHEEFSEEHEHEKEILPKKKTGTDKKQQKTDTVLKGLQEMMRSFIEQQRMIDVQWRDMVEKQAAERDVSEQEWRQKMEKLERERLMVDRAWREREDQRKSREENRAVKRDAFLTALLNKLLRDEI